MHHARINVLMVGPTSGGRKGTAQEHSKRIFRMADEQWFTNGLLSGLASGEGLIARLEQGARNVVVLESEFTRTLAVASRDGSILSQIIRDDYDTGWLQSMTRKNPLSVSDAHVGIVGQSTAEELKARLPTTEIANGLVNRFIIGAVKRSRKLPHGGNLSNADLAHIAKRLRAALNFARSTNRVRRSAQANHLWEKIYNAVPDPQGLLGALTARAEAQMLRLSLIYALLDCSNIIEVPHLVAAVGLWQYGVDSAAHIFGATLGDDVADRVLERLREAHPAGMTREEIRGIFTRHILAARLTAALSHLQSRNLVRTEKGSSGGAPRQTSYAVTRTEGAKSADSAESPNSSDLIALIAPFAPQYAAKAAGRLEL